jgi:hypothetical protein
MILKIIVIVSPPLNIPLSNPPRVPAERKNVMKNNNMNNLFFIFLPPAAFIVY